MDTQEIFRRDTKDLMDELDTSNRENLKLQKALNESIGDHKHTSEKLQQAIKQIDIL